MCYKKPKCPHCGFRFSEDHVWHQQDGCEFPTEPGEETADCFFCPQCGKELYCEVDWTPTWIFVDEDGEHIYFQGASHA